MTSKTNPPRRERTAVELWNHAVREAHAGDDGSDASDVLEASDDEIERQLLAAGVDLAAEDAAAGATYPVIVAKLEADEQHRQAAEDGDAPGGTVAWVAPTALRPARPRSRAVWLAYALAAAAAIGGAAYAVGHRGPEPPPEPPPHDEPVVHPVETVPAPPPPPAPTQSPGPDKPEKGPAR